MVYLRLYFYKGSVCMITLVMTQYVKASNLVNVYLRRITCKSTVASKDLHTD